jgi:hypothetical protein
MGIEIIVNSGGGTIVGSALIKWVKCRDPVSKLSVNLTLFSVNLKTSDMILIVQDVTNRFS